MLFFRVPYNFTFSMLHIVITWHSIDGRIKQNVYNKEFIRIPIFKMFLKNLIFPLNKETLDFQMKRGFLKVRMYLEVLKSNYPLL